MPIKFEPLISSTLWLTLAVVLTVLLAIYAWRRPWGLSPLRWATTIGLMALCAAALLLILCNPTWIETLPPPAGKPQLTIVVDDSASMAAADMPDGRSRYATAAQIAEACSEKLAQRFDVKVETFSNVVRPMAVKELGSHTPSGSITDLAAAVSGSIDSSRRAEQAILLLSDGNHNAGGGTARVLSSVALARAADTPIFTRTLGSDAAIHDLAVRLHSPQQLSFIGQSVPIVALVRRRGRAPESVVVSLLQDDREIGRQTVLVPGDVEVEARFQVQQPERGLYRYEVKVEPFAGEVTQVNNYGTFVLRVVDEPVRVLLVEGKPYWDSKFLARTLSSDPSIELVCIVRMTEGRYLERTLKRIREKTDDKAKAKTPANGDKPGEDSKAQPSIADIPVTESWRVLENGSKILADAKALGTFQIVVLGRDADDFLADEALNNLRSWVATDSGVLVCYRGQPTTQISERLDKMLPVEWQAGRESRFRVTLTDRGRDLRWFEPHGGSSADALPYLPALATSSSAEEPKALATVLAAVPSKDGHEVPVVTYQPYGGGKVVVVEGSGMWRWAFLPPAYADHDTTYGILWQSLLRWLVSRAGLLPGQDMALRTDQVTFGTSEPATATLLIRKEAAQSQVPVVELVGAAIDSPRELVPSAAGDAPGVYRVMFGNLPEGRYKARIIGQSAEKSGSQAEFDVRRQMEEQLDLKARPDLMARIARTTGGLDLQSDDPAKISDAFVSHLEKGHPERIRRITLWDNEWVLGGTLLLWTIAWAVRRSSGLV
jgi:hypothetical protein